MGFFSRLLGIEDDADRRRANQASGPRAKVAELSEAQAVERYRYMVQTAPPETLEQAHAEAFGKLSPEQRRKLLDGLKTAAPAAEQSAIASTSADDPRALARVATRAEIRDPGVMERTLGGAGMGMGASLLSSFAMGFVGSMVAQSFMSAMGGFGDDEPGETDGEVAEHDATAEDEAWGDDGGDGGDFDV
jgi:hypothetical protein